MPQLNLIQGIMALFNFMVMAILIMKLMSKKLAIKSPASSS